jgi:alginate O-acetyltransferase complex protein AlgI
VLFTEPAFLFVFLPVLLGLYALCPGAARNALLLGASLVFYAMGAGAFTSLVLVSIAVNYVAALWIARLGDRPRAVWALRVTVAGNLVVLALFKYAGFAAENLNVALAALGVSAVPVPAIALPIGISFFTFHAISYVVDVKRGDAVAQKGPVAAALYLLLFPQLIAGPIIRYRDIAGQLHRRTVALGDVAYGARRFIVGLAKKMLVANIVAVPADAIFARHPDELTATLAWLAVSCYTLQIYFDFSGYSDMAVGLGRLFGFRFPENFRYPYAATSVQDFWRRWHISLSTWFRDYVYVPLGGSRGSTSRVYLNLVTVFFLCGLWHGANWTFVAWGLFHGVFLVLERLGRSLWTGGTGAAALPRALAHAYTIAVVMMGWTLFRAETLDGAWRMLAAMVGAGEGRPGTHTWAWYVTPELVVTMLVGLVAATPASARLAERLVPANSDSAGPRLSWVMSAGCVAILGGLLVASVALGAAQTYSPFIYFRF